MRICPGSSYCIDGVTGALIAAYGSDKESKANGEKGIFVSLHIREKARMVSKFERLTCLMPEHLILCLVIGARFS